MITWTERAKTAVSQKSHGGTAVTDEISVVKLSAVSSAAAESISAFPAGHSTVLAVRSLSEFEKHDSSIAVIEDPDRWCWPRSSAMNGAELDTFSARLYRFTDKGLARIDGQALADKLVMRDRNQDDRRVCLECKHFAGHGSGSWRCGNGQTAGIAICPRDAQLPADLVVQLQRCDGFTAHRT